MTQGSESDRSADALAVAVEAALEAGARLRDEFHRPGGPRGRHGHAEVDGEAEAGIRRRLAQAFPDHGIRGEELGQQDRPPRDAARHLWLVDPQDGTSAFLAGWRGAAVSRIVLPLAAPGVLTAIMFAFTISWGHFIYALAFVSSNPKKMVNVGLVTELIRGDVFFWGELMAGALLTSLPIIFLYGFFAKRFVSGLTAGGIKA